jgi:hypothetical protein
VEGVKERERERDGAPCLKKFGMYICWPNLQNAVVEGNVTPVLYVGRTAHKGSYSGQILYPNRLNVWCLICTSIKETRVCVCVCVWRGGGGVGLIK